MQNQAIGPGNAVPYKDSRRAWGQGSGIASDGQFPEMFLPFRYSLVGEGITAADAAKLAGVTQSAVRRWMTVAPIAFKVGGYSRVNRIALRLYLSNDSEGLAAFAGENFAHPNVVAAYRAEKMPIPTDGTIAALQAA